MITNTKVDWAQNRGHDSAAQYSIWHCLQMLSPLKTVKAEIDGFDAGCVADGQNDFYSFMKTLYQDMYANPDSYLIPTVAYDEYMKNEGANEQLFDEHKTDAKENKLRQEFQQAIHFYPNYFYQLGLAADAICVESYALIINKQKYNNVIKALDTPHTRKDNYKRLQALVGRGITVKEADDVCYISCKHARKMFIGLKILCDAPESNFKYINYLRLDFEGYLGAVPDIEAIKLTMDRKHSDMIAAFSPLLDEPKMKHTITHFGSITTNSKWKVEYKLNSKRVFEFYTGPAYLVIHIFFKDLETLTKIIDMLETDNVELFMWLRDLLIEKLCDCPRNRAILFGNYKKRICGSSNKVEISNPTKDDVSKSISLMKAIRNL